MPSIFDQSQINGPKIQLLSEGEAKRSVVILNIPPKTTVENVVIHFQRKKNGGGEINNAYISRERTAVVTFEDSEVVEEVMKQSHKLEGSELKVQRFVSDHPPECFQKVTARVNFGRFQLSSQESCSALRVLKDEAKVSGDVSTAMECVLTGTFDQIKTAHDVLQGMLKGSPPFQQLKGIKKQTSSGTFDTEVKYYPDTNVFNSLEVQPQFMKLLKLVYKTQLQEIEEKHGVNIIWSEKASQVQIRPTTTKDPGSYQKGSDAFINLYQDLYPKMRREEIELKISDDKELVTEAEICSMECEHNMVIEMEENKLVVYAEENKISVAIQALKETVGLSKGSRKEARRGQRNVNHHDISQQNRFSTQVLSHDLKNGVKLVLYQSDITQERVDAIVNAANEWLQHAGGVAAAIVRKGGRKIEEESRQIISQRNRRPLSVGDAVHTAAGNLPCRFVVHTVGPRWSSLEREKCASLLYRACTESLYLAAKLELCSIALPPISSGIFGMPKDTCAQVMFEAVEDFSSSPEVEFSTLRDVRIVIIDDETMGVFNEEFVKRYTSQGMAHTDAAQSEVPSYEERENSATNNFSLEQPLFSSPEEKNDDDRPNGQHKQSSEGNASVNTSPEEGPNIGKSNHHEMMYQSIKSDTNNIATASKLSPSTDIEAPSMESQANETHKEKPSSASAAKPSAGRGRGVLAPLFSGRVNVEVGPQANRNIQLHIQHETNGARVKIGRGTTYATSNRLPPGLVVTDEGKSLAATDPFNLMSDNLNTNRASSMVSEREAEVMLHKENQTPIHSNQESDEEKMKGESSLGHSNFNMKDDSITDPKKTGKGSTEESLTDGEQKLRIDENTYTYKPGDEQHDTEMDMEVEQSVSGDAPQGDVTSPQNAVAPNQSSSICGQQAMQERRDPEGGNNHTSSAHAGVAPLFKMLEIHETNQRDCAMCMNQQKDPVYGLSCGHYFCKSCINCFIEKSGICPQCRHEKVFKGNQPVGYMTWRTESRKRLFGYETCGTIVITYNFKEGNQGPEHPNPGQRYREFFCTAYLPDNPAGKEVCNLLRRAFNGRLMFTIGKCPATGEENNIVFNGIELKTSRTGGPANCGYPDPSYLDRVKSQLAEKGITQLYDQTFV